MPADDPSPAIQDFRWFHPTPGRLLVVLLVAEGILLLCDWFRWPPKGWAVLISIAAVALTIVLMLLWFALALVFRWRFQFSIRSLMLLTVAVALPFSWLAVEMKWASRQKETVENLTNLAAIVLYDYEYDYEDTVHPKGTQHTLAWLRNRLGDDFFRHVTVISLFIDTEITNADLKHLNGLNQLRILHLETPEVTDTGLEHLRGLRQLQRLEIYGARITDAGLEHLKGLNQLKILHLEKSQVTDVGVAELQKALPNCKIEH